MTAPRAELAEELLRRFAATFRSGQLYSKGHPIIARNLEALTAAMQLLHGFESSIVIGIVGEEVIVDDKPVRADGMSTLVRRLKHIGIERISIDRDATTEEITALIATVSTLEAKPDGNLPDFPVWPHVRIGRVVIAHRIEGAQADMAEFKRLYGQAVAAAETIWESARTDGQPDVTAAKSMVDGLAQAMSQNRTALLALTALKEYDNYTFTHMVNVSLLTMGQARALGIDGPLLREFGLSALMHDIGKTRTPLVVLNKPGKLTDAEFTIMKRHTVDGAEILRQTRDIPTLAPVVAFEHHLRLDGSGYPAGVSRPTLNVGTMLCSIADVYDAMRSQRAYQKAFPSDRILEVMKRSDGQQFDQNLVRRFTQLVGIYPVGNLVLLNTGETAVVVKIYAPDPHRPQVRVIIDGEKKRLDAPYDVNLWDGAANEGAPSSVAAPIDPAQLGIDPLTFL
jgi:putative nucleotidyltransferase with HDIG domain